MTPPNLQIPEEEESRWPNDESRSEFSPNLRMQRLNVINVGLVGLSEFRYGPACLPACLLSTERSDSCVKNQQHHSRQRQSVKLCGMQRKVGKVRVMGGPKESEGDLREGIIRFLCLSIPPSASLPSLIFLPFHRNSTSYLLIFTHHSLSIVFSATHSNCLCSTLH